MSEDKDLTPIEILCAQLRSADDPPDGDSVRVSEILVPEECAEISIGDKLYHLTIEEIVEEDDTLHARSATPIPAEDDKPNKLSEEFMREAEEAVRKAEKEIRDFFESDLMRSRTQFEAITTDLADHPVVLCHAEGLEELFDGLAQWNMTGEFGLYEKLVTVRAMRDAKQSGWDHGLDCDFTKRFQPADSMPFIIIQMS